MKKLVITLVVALFLITPLMGTGQAKAEESAWAVDFDFTFNSKYVWRGMNVVDGWVMQPSLNVSKGGFTTNIWGNLDLSDENEAARKFTEVDLTVEYAFELGDFTIPVGLIYYAFPNTDVGDTTELYTGVSYDWVVSPGLAIYYDVDEAHGFYTLLSADYSYEFPIDNKKVSAGIDAGVGVSYATGDYNDFYFGIDSSTWNDWYAKVAFPVSVLEGKLVFTPAVTYTALIDSDLKDTTEDDTNTFFGLSVTFSF